MGCKGKKAPGMHIHKAISEGWDGTGRDGTGWDGTGRDGTDAAECDDGNMTCVCRIVGFNRTLKLWIQNLRHEEENPSVIHCAFVFVFEVLGWQTAFLREQSCVMWLWWWPFIKRPFPCNLNPSPCSFLNIYILFLLICVLFSVVYSNKTYFIPFHSATIRPLKMKNMSSEIFLFAYI